MFQKALRGFRSPGTTTGRLPGFTRLRHRFRGFALTQIGIEERQLQRPKQHAIALLKKMSCFGEASQAPGTWHSVLQSLASRRQA